MKKSDSKILSTAEGKTKLNVKKLLFEGPQESISLKADIILTSAEYNSWLHCITTKFKI